LCRQGAPTEGGRPSLVYRRPLRIGEGAAVIRIGRGGGIEPARRTERADILAIRPPTAEATIP